MHSNIKPIKSLGQNFLKSNDAAKSLIKLIKKGDNVIEIGPGEGIITNEILKKTSNITCIEKDKRLCNILESRFPNISVLNMDVLDLNLEEIEYESFQVVGALPYYISKDIISKFIKGEIRPYNLSVILQKEVAQKYISSGELLNNTVKIYAREISGGEIIKKEEFYPKPKVDSKIIYIKDIYKYDKNQVIFEKFIKRNYSNPRKKLRNVNQSISWGEFEHRRAQELSFEDWVRLYEQNRKISN